MGRRPKFSKELREEIVQRYLNGERPILLMQRYGFAKSSLRTWLRKYQKFGMAGLTSPKKNQRYSLEFKRQVVEAYRSGAGSALDLAVRYDIPSRGTVASWVKQYNSHEDTLESYSGGRIRMTKGRKTTLDERVAIVEYCIDHKLNYTQTAEQFQVSYQQVYTWVKKYNERGVSALRDNRGKGKPIEDMTELERLQAENRKLQMENDVLKKVAELERRRSSVFNNKRRNI
jgi:transposase-like protein